MSRERERDEQPATDDHLGLERKTVREQGRRRAVEDLRSGKEAGSPCW
jgi:hypothetical protein